MLKDAKQPNFKLLRVDGGASRNNLLMQLQADAIQVASLSAADLWQYLSCAETLSLPEAAWLIDILSPTDDASGKPKAHHSPKLMQTP